MSGSTTLASDGNDPTWFTPFASVVSAGLAAGAMWLTQRIVGKAAFQTAINTGFQALLEEQRKAFEVRVKILRQELDDERKANNSERAQWAAETAQLRGEIINLTQTVESLKSILRRNNIPVPSSVPPRPPTALMELRQDGTDDDEDGGSLN